MEDRIFDCKEQASKREKKSPSSKTPKKKLPTKGSQRSKVKTIAEIGDEADKAGVSYGVYVAMTELKAKNAQKER